MGNREIIERLARASDDAASRATQVFAEQVDPAVAAAVERAECRKTIELAERLLAKVRAR